MLPVEGSGPRSTPDVEHAPAKRLEPPGDDRFARPPHQFERPGHVVDRDESGRRRLTDPDEVPEVAAAEYLDPGKGVPDLKAALDAQDNEPGI